MADEKQCESGPAAAPTAQQVAAPVKSPEKRSTTPVETKLVAFPAAAIHAQFDFRYVAPTADFAPTTNSAAAFNVPGGTSVWDGLKEFRSRGNVQVMTLWQSNRFMVSLQSGKNGTAALQWSSKSLDRGATTRGLLDGMFHHAEEPAD
jgi:hypothetical protein